MTRRLRRLRMPLWLLAGGVVVAGLALRRAPADEPRPSRQEPGNELPATPPAPAAPRPVVPECYLGVVVSEVRIEVPARVEGSVQALDVQVGDTVETGRLLARIGAESVGHELASERAALEAAQAEERRAVLRAELAAHTHRRQASLTDLLSKEQIEESRFELDGARLDAEAAAARVRQAEARLEALEARASRARIVAPIDGVVAAVHVEPGAIVAPGTPVVRLIGAGGRVRFAFPPEDADLFQRGTPVQVRVDGLDHRTAATVTSLAPEIDPESQMVFAEATLAPEVRSAQRLPIGAVVRVARQGSGAPCVEEVSRGSRDAGGLRLGSRDRRTPAAHRR